MKIKPAHMKCLKKPFCLIHFLKSEQTFLDQVKPFNTLLYKEFYTYIKILAPYDKLGKNPNITLDFTV